MNAPLPRVVLHQVATADGRLALSPGVLLMGDARWPTYDDGAYADVLRRHRPGALLEGSGSFVPPETGPLDLPDTGPADLPEAGPLDLPDVGPADLREDSPDGGPTHAENPGGDLSSPAPDDVGRGGREDSPDGGPPGGAPAHFLPEEVLARTTRWFAVVDSRGRVAWQFTEFPDPDWAGTHLLVLVGRATAPGYLAFLRSRRIPYLVAGERGVDLARALRAMGEILGVADVVATCGAHLGGSLLRAGLVDELEIEALPILAGGRDTPVMLTCPDLGPTDELTALRLLEATARGDGRVLLRYAVVGPREATRPGA